ncbi:uncharacterized protein LOC106759622 isoform X2 [Vigna radiata var. radiata]|uniref:Uncharacterized protein LOC106759622 isoform X2 n=1 Tax=Vigna radiata var. radiata TaxID=3916 RepID=A0A3Q0EWZ5_VIGRR|nr:uncharacterized protein LOC106759622 isoform X2 [Vigna radiata var. radiata]
MSWAKGQSAGWTAFDLKQRKNINFESEVDKDHFPAIGTSESTVKKNHLPAKPFSSVLLPTKHFPPLKEGLNNKKAVLGSDSDEKYCEGPAQEDVNLAIKKLREQNLWAEHSLIEDILAAVNNNVDKASALLETMASAVNFEDYKVSSAVITTTDDTPYKNKTNESLTLGKVKDDIPFDNHQDNDKVLENRNVSPIQNLLNSVPVEPEWEDDDIYISNRKDALKTMRSASRHSRAASFAFLRGDHLSAQHHSMKARVEWHTAEELNSDAARKILSIRNNENDIWRLDLHGLHATEAIQALQEHLYKIESQGFLKSSSNGVKQNGLGQSTLINSAKLDIQAPLRLRPLALHVITGVGNHSRGQASLPTAVRSFLNENRRGISIEPFCDPPNCTSNLMENFGATQRTPSTTTTPSSSTLDTYESKGHHEKLYTDFKIYWPFNMPLTSEAAALRVIRNLENLGLYYTLFVWIILFIVLIPHLFAAIVQLILTEAGIHLAVTLACAVPLVLVHAVLWVSHHAFEIEDDSCTREFASVASHNRCTCGAKGIENV